MDLKTKKIHLKNIDFKDKTFLLSYGYDLKSLKQSIKQVGLLNPPVVRKKAASSYQIICGFKDEPGVAWDVDGLNQGRNRLPGKNWARAAPHRHIYLKTHRKKS